MYRKNADWDDQSLGKNSLQKFPRMLIPQLWVLNFNEQRLLLLSEIVEF